MMHLQSFYPNNEHFVIVYSSMFVQIEAAFTKYDISGDDMLNYKEFCDMIHKREDK